MNNANSTKDSVDWQRDKSKSTYIDGSLAKKLQPEDKAERHKKQRTTKPHKQQMRIEPMNMGYLVVMAVSILLLGAMLIWYMVLQADITDRTNNVAKLEQQLNDLTLSNDETYTKIISSVDLDEIKRIAIEELGMKYAKEGQVITYTGEGNDYVTQYQDIPQNP